MMIMWDFHQWLVCAGLSVALLWAIWQWRVSERISRLRGDAIRIAVRGLKIRRTEADRLQAAARILIVAAIEDNDKRQEEMMSAALVELGKAKNARDEFRSLEKEIIAVENQI